MFGYVEWSGERKNRRTVTAGERVIGGVRFYAVTLYRGEKSRPGVLRRRCGAAARLLKKAGAGRVVLPPELPWEDLFTRQGLRVVGDTALRRELAAELVSFAMAERGLAPGGATVAVTAERLSAEVIRAVTALCRRSRYILLSVPYGGEAFCREMRRTHGVSVLLAPTAEQLEQADVLVQFVPGPELRPRNQVTLPLYAGAAQAFSWSASVPGQGEPEERTALLAALWEAGALRPECLEIRSLDFHA